MSDGPHRSLKMAMHWKKLAACADNIAYSDTDTQSKLQKALLKDWMTGIPQKLHDGIAIILEGINGSLFPDDRIEQLRQLECHAAGYDLGQLYLDHAIRMASFGHCSIVEVVSSALRSWSARRLRQIEEHYIRNTGGERVDKVRSRLERAFETSANHELASQAVGEARPTATKSNHKKTGLDEGVTL